MVGQVLYGEAQTLVWSGCTYGRVKSSYGRGVSVVRRHGAKHHNHGRAARLPLPRHKRQPREVHARSPASHRRVASCGLVARVATEQKHVRRVCFPLSLCARGLRAWVFRALIFRGHWPVFCMRLPAQAASLCVAVAGDPCAGNHLKWRCNPSPGSCRLHRWG